MDVRLTWALEQVGADKDLCTTTARRNFRFANQTRRCAKSSAHLRTFRFLRSSFDKPVRFSSLATLYRGL